MSEFLKRVRNLLSSDRPLSRRRGLRHYMSAARMESLEDRTLLAVNLVKDINVAVESASSNPSRIVDVGGTTFFTANVEGSGEELWKSDGTAEGTVLVKDIRSGLIGSNPTYLTNVNGTLYFRASDGVNGEELWKSDGTAAGTVPVKDIGPGVSGSNPRDLTNVNGTLFFRATNGVNGEELWKSDGTAAGTVQVKDIRSGSGSSSPNSLIEINGALFFRANDGLNGEELWKSDGTAAGTVMVKDILSGSGSSSPASLTNMNGTLYFSASDGANGAELWKSDGTAAGTLMVKDILNGSGGSSPISLMNMNGTLYFRASDGVNGVELWKSDGTALGTVLIKDIRSGSSSSIPSYLTNVNGTLYFRAWDGLNGEELWKSDGTAAGTVLVKDILSGSSSSGPFNLTNVNGTLYFRATDGLNGPELWRSDGTAVGTVLVKDILAGSVGSDVRYLTNVNGALYFSAIDGVNGRELWKSDGTTMGTVLVKDLFSRSGSSPEILTNVNGTLYFTAIDGVNGRELWKSDGTLAGTVMVKDIIPGSNSPFYLDNLTNMNGNLYFRSDDGVTGGELWKSDGTAIGTVRVKDIRSGSSGSSPSFLTVVNSTLYFVATDSLNGAELWKSDGTTAGTVLVKDIQPGSNSSGIRNLTNVNGTLFFQADDGVNGYELWKSDGTAAGTVLVKDIRAGSSSSNIRDLTTVNGILFFRANDGVNGEELWKSDGTGTGTVLVRDIWPGSTTSSVGYLTNVNGTLYFRANDNVTGMELWKSDGTEAGTMLVKDGLAGIGGINPNNLANINGTLYFRASSGLDGQELWKSDGTAAGTSMVKDIRPGSVSSNPRNFTNVNGTLYFLARDESGLDELWKSDGTAVGTVPASNGFPGSGASAPTSLVAVGERLFFSAFDPSVGRELWVAVDPPLDAAPPIDIHLTNNALLENQPIGTFVGTLTTTDPNTGDSFTYSLVGGEGSSGNSAFVIDGAFLRTRANLDFESQPGYSVRVRSTDQWGLSFEKVFTVAVGDLNEAPVSVTLSKATVEENQPVGTVVGQLSTSDFDFGNTFTYDLVSGIGGTDNAQFTIVGDSIRTAGVLNQAVQSSYSIRVRSTDQGGLSIEQPLVISVAVNQAPTEINLINVITSLPENTSTTSAIKVADIVVSDDGLGTNNLFRINTGVSSLQFEIVGSELRLKAGSILDYEATQSLSVGIGVNDPAVGQAVDAATSYILELIDINEAPTITLENRVTSILDKTNIPDGMRVADILVSDDALGNNSVSLSGPDAGVFEIAGTSLRLKAGTVLDLATTQFYSVSVDVNDASIPGAPDASTAFTIVVNDRPTVVGRSLATTAGLAVSAVLSGNDLYGEPLTYRITQFPENGTVSGTGSNRTYSPNPGFSGVDEFYYVANDGATDSFEGRVQITVQAVKPIVTFITPSSIGSENAGRYPVTAFVSQAQPTDLYIPLILSGTAIRDLDYVSNGQIVIPAGQNYGSFVVNILDDTNYEPTPETIVATIATSSFYDLTTVNTHTVSINDNDTVPQLSFQTRSISVSESGQTVDVGLVLSGDSPVPITVFLNYTGTASRFFDYTGVNGLTIPAGARSASFPVTIVDDILPENAETIQVSVRADLLQGAVLSSGVDSASQSLITIAANDRPTVSFKTASRKVNESGDFVTVEATLSEPASFDRTVSFTLDGTASPLNDFGLLSTPETGASNTFYFAAGSTTATRTIRIDNDATPESTETVVLTLQSNGFDTPGATRKFTLQIIDDDKITVSLQHSEIIVWEDAGTITIHASLSAPALKATVIPFSISSALPLTPAEVAELNREFQQEVWKQALEAKRAGKKFIPPKFSEPDPGLARITDDFTTTASLDYYQFGEFRFEIGDTNATLTFNITDDLKQNEGIEEFNVSLGAMPKDVSFGTVSTTKIIIKDNDAVASLYSYQQSIGEANASVWFMARLSAPVNRDLVFPITWSGVAERDMDYEFADDWVVIPAGRVFVYFSCRLRDDALPEENESIVATLGAAAALGLPGSPESVLPLKTSIVLSGSTAQAEVIDNDNDRLPKVAFYRSIKFEGSLRDVRVTDADRYLVEGRESVEYKIKTIGATSRETRVRLEIEGNHNTESVGYDFYTISGLDSVHVSLAGVLIDGWLTIPAGTVEASFTITPLNNSDYHGDVEFTITILEATNATTSGRSESTRFKIFDDEQVPVLPRNSPSSLEVLSSAGAGSLVIDPRAAAGQISGLSVGIGDLNNATIETTTGSLMIGFGKNGLLDAATVFLDSNFNGVQDFLDLNNNGVQDVGEPSELATVTQIDGSFALYISPEYDFNGDGVLDQSEGRWVLAGGIDTSTAEQYKTNLTAPIGFYSISPLTTLAESLIRTQNYTVDSALTRINLALGIDGYDFANSNPLYAILYGDGVAAGADRELNKVSGTVIQVASLLSGFSAGELSVQLIADLVYDEMALLIAEEGSVLELSLPSIVELIIDRVSFRTGLALESDVVTGAALIIVATSEKLDALNLTDFSSGKDFVVALTKIKNVAQNDAAEALYAVGAGTLSISNAVVEFTGALLDQKIAAEDVGIVVPPVVGVGDAIVREQANGTTVMTFEVALVGEHDYPVSVRYRTVDDSATVADNDYVATTGVLVWAPNDTSSKFVDVVVTGDTLFEVDETIRLQLYENVGAAIRVQEGFGFIANDDAFSFASDEAQTANDLRLIPTVLDLELVQNGTTQWFGEFVDPVTGQIEGQDSADDVLTLDYSYNSFRDDKFSFNGGAGSGADSFRVYAGTFFTIEHQVFGGQSGITRFWSDSVNAAGRMNWIETEFVHLDVGAVNNLTLRFSASVADVIVEDADPAQPGRMRIRSASGAFTPVEFTNPTERLTLIFDDPAATATIDSLDSAFSGVVQQGSLTLGLSSTSIAESASVGAVVGTFSTTHGISAGDTFVYSLVNGDGGVDNSSFQIVGNELKTNAELDFETKSIYVIRVRTTDQNGIFVENELTITVDDVVEDTTRPVSAVLALPLNATSLLIPISVSGIDPNGPVGSTPSGVKEFDLYVAQGSGPFVKFATVPFSNPNAVFTATSNHTYFFRSVARDNAGNEEIKAANYAEAFIRVGDLDKPTTQVTSANPSSTGLFTLTFSGGEVGGSQLAAFDLYVSIDNEAPVLIGSVSGGTAVSGVYSATATYQGLADGIVHTYRFYSRGRDTAGNVEDAPVIGDVTTTQTFAAPPALQATGIDVQGGARQRSFINKVDLFFNTATGVSALTGANRIKVERFALSATSVTPGTGIDVPIGSLVLNGSRLTMNFGSALSNDGFYRIRVDVNGDGDYDDAGESFEFHRLLGDANGDAIVDVLDTAVVDSLFGCVGSSLDADLNGDGVVNTADKSFTLRSYRGRKLSDLLKPLLDD